jgi:hypothetical protein
MSKLTFLAHLPLLRIEEDEAAFGEGSLWRLPFDIYDQLSGGAFSVHRKDYEATVPVFYRADTDPDLPMLQPTDPKPPTVAELKSLPTTTNLSANSAWSLFFTSTNIWLNERAPPCC